MRLEILQGDLNEYHAAGGLVGVYNVPGGRVAVVLDRVVYCCRRLTLGDNCGVCGKPARVQAEAPAAPAGDPIAA